ncbi:secretin N-terminal domain-containing protein [Mesorhizobium silamurunense]|uniref:secretin N-terminal domain-containing protein n=1 Tax=Mesorhizobium silamurunense TaxID=499528 RepID=UPI00177F3F5C|nr:secretin N-terminal domain-containing protein [Mesorhizobium silamurunense]
MRDAIAVFDVDWMKGRSVALLPLKNAKPGPVATEPESIFGKSGKDASLVRFVPNERMNAVLVIASKPVYLQRAEAWIRKLDQAAPGDGEQMFVYQKSGTEMDWRSLPHPSTRAIGWPGCLVAALSMPPWD